MTSKDKLIEFLKSAEIEYWIESYSDKEVVCMRHDKDIFLDYSFSPTGDFLKFELI